MAKSMKIISIVTLLLTVCFALLYIHFGNGVFLTVAISTGTTAYHFVFRLLVGYFFDATMKNKANYNKRWFCVGKGELKFYKFLKVKHWKDKMPTFDPKAFDVSNRTWDQIAQATCQSELVHETNVVLSFLPIVASVWFGSIWVFVVTSVLSAIFDLLFVFMQRFNRHRILRMQARLQKSNKITIAN